jgi:hypothetical protein
MGEHMDETVGDFRKRTRVLEDVTIHSVELTSHPLPGMEFQPILGPLHELEEQPYVQDAASSWRTLYEILLDMAPELDADECRWEDDGGRCLA